MRWSNFFTPTLREVPAEAEVASHRLLLRAGFIRQLAAGVYSYLPLAKRSLLKIEAIIRQEMERIGAQEFYLPALHPAEVWKESGRWEQLAEIMFQFKDRTGRDVCLGVTHEEVFTTIVRDSLRSYRELPQIWYQIQVKFRDEPRPKSGLLRVRQFTMKDSYSFDLNEEGLDRSYELHRSAYCKIFDRCGLQYTIVQAESGAMGGSESEEFIVATEAGEDWVVRCSSCGYAANLERAESRVEPVEDAGSGSSVEKVHTPGQKTIQQVGDFLEEPSHRQIKSLLYIVESKPCLVLLRGDHQLNENKLARALGSELFRPASEEEIRRTLGAGAGSLGPVGVPDLRIVADNALAGRTDMICGANEDDYHLLHVDPGRDFKADYFDLRLAEAGQGCVQCGQSLVIMKAVEVGHIFKLGYKYSESMGATVLDQQGREVPIIMGSYGIGVERILSAAAELFHDELGLIWPVSIAPFRVVVTLVRPEDEAQQSAAQTLYKELWNHGIDTLLDDRDERPGVKFKDAELIGFPVRITVGKKLQDGQVEVFFRSDQSSRDLPLDQAVPFVLEYLAD